jgi:hypothetical protein
MEWELHNVTLSPDNRFLPGTSQSNINWVISWSGQGQNVLSLQNFHEKNGLPILQFPKFTAGSKTIQAPGQFYQPIKLEKMFINYLLLTFQPWKGILCSLEYLVADNQGIICRFFFCNRMNAPFSFSLEWVVNPSFFKKQQPVLVKNGKLQFIKIESGNQVLLTGMLTAAKPGSESIPLLSHTFCLNSQENSEIMISSGSGKSTDDVYKIIDRMSHDHWQAKVARMEIENKAAMLEISTGHPDWDMAIQFSQIQAQRFIFQFAKKAEDPDFLTKSSGTSLAFFDLVHLTHAAGIWMPEQCKKMLSGYFNQQQEDDPMSWVYPPPHKVLAGIAFPMVFVLAADLYGLTGDLQWLTNLYPQLKKYLLAWFTKENDKDQYGCPEWQNAYQAGLDEAILHKQYPHLLHPYIYCKFENPGLLFLLRNELAQAMTLASIVAAEPDISLWQQKDKQINQQLQRFWLKNKQKYQILDYQIHQNNKTRNIINGKGRLHYKNQVSFKNAVRLQIVLHLQEGYTRPYQGKIIGRTINGPQQESIHYAHFIWQNKQAFFVSNNAYTQIEEIQLSGLQEDESWQIQTYYYAYEDLSMLLPLIARKKNKKMPIAVFDHPTFKSILHPMGLPNVTSTAAETQSVAIASIPWNTIILRQCLNSGDMASANCLFEKIIATAIEQIKQENGLFAYYDCNNGHGLGEKNSLRGLLPLSLFLQLLGIKGFTDYEIVITHFNPYPESITVQYRGIKAILKSDCVEVHCRGLIDVITKPGKYRIFFSMNVVK